MLILEQIRCPQCNRRLMDLSGQAQVRCPKCKTLVGADTDKRQVYILERQDKSAGHRNVG